MDDFFAIQQQIFKNVQNYEEDKAGKLDPYERLVRTLETPYNEMLNRDEFISVLRGLISSQAAEFWQAFPDYTFNTVPITSAEAAKNLSPEIRNNADSLAKELVNADLLYEDADQNGNAVYVRNYLFGLAYDTITAYDENGNYLGSPYDKIIHEWWDDLVESSSKTLRSGSPAMRTAPHQGVIDGNAKHGRIPMNLEIPDMRQALPLDDLDAIIDSCSAFTVVDCMCRRAKEHIGDRECDSPTEGVCIMLNEAAAASIAAGTPALTAEDIKAIIRKCRDAGLVQQVSDSVRPQAICNCCKCCCLLLKSLQRYEGGLSLPSRWQATVHDMDRCIGCGACMKVCPVDAVSDNQYSMIDVRRCIGCGLCAAKCPKGVLKMTKRPGAQEKPGHYTEERLYI